MKWPIEFVSLVPTTDIGCGKALLEQNAGREVTALANLAIHGDFSVSWNLANPVAKLIHGDIDGARNVPLGKLPGRADIEQERPLIRRSIEDLLDVDLWMIAPKQPGGDETGHVHGIFRRSILRRIGQLHLLQVKHGHPRLDGDREDVDPLIYTGSSHGLRAQDPARIRVKEKLQRHPLGAGIVAGVVRGMDVDLAIRLNRRA